MRAARTTPRAVGRAGRAAETARSRSSKRRLSPSTPGKRDVQDVRRRPARVAVLARARDRAQLAARAVAQRGEPRRLALRGRELVGLAHADDLVRRERAGAQAPLLPAAVQLRRERDARARRRARRRPSGRRACARSASTGRSAPRASVERQLAALCAASTWNSTPRSRQSAPIAATSWITPVSLLTCMIETSSVSAPDRRDDRARARRTVRASAST